MKTINHTKVYLQRSLFFLLPLLLVAGLLQAQPAGFVLSGKVLFANGSPAASASVRLLAAKDSSLIKAEITSNTGGFAFAHLPRGEYWVSVSFTGHNRYGSAPVRLMADAVLPDIVLMPAEKEMGEVKVVAQRPIIEQKYDKLIFNVSGNVSTAGDNALEVLAKAPGVMVDQNGAVSLGGRSGVLILIDGRRTHLSEADLTAYLRGLPASTIDRIDLISNPSAQYEAAGTSGIIDIRLKKDNRYGYNGSASLAYIKGTASSGNGSVNFNYRNKKINIYGTMAKSYDDVDGKQITDRRFFVNNTQENGSVHTDNVRDFRFHNNNLRLGADYYLDKRTIIGIMGMGIANTVKADYTTRTDNYYPGDSTDFALDRSRNTNRRYNAAFNLNMKRTIDSGGREWSFDVDYAPYANRDDIDLRAHFYNEDKTPNRPFYHLVGDLNGKLSVYSTRFDYQLPRVWGGTLQMGVRSSLVKADNDLLFYDRSSGTDVLDAGKTNHFLYTENINAAYLNYQMKRNKLSVQAGLRMENTNGEGRQVTSGQHFDRSYIQLFPNIFTGYEVGKNYTLGFSVARRIDRPSYRDLNPFRFYGSPFGYTEGNPLLNPQLTFVAEWSNTFFRKYIARFSYSRTKDNIGMVWGTDPFNMRTSAQRPVNLNQATNYRLTLTAPVNARKWYTSFTNVIGAYARFEGEAFHTALDRGLPWFYVSSNHTFRVTSTLSLELNGWYRSALLSGGYQRMVPASAVAVGVGKRIMAGKGNLRFTVSDVFKTSVGHGVTALNNFRLDVRQWNETRRATLSFSYNFGRSGVAAARNRTSSAEEERARAAQ
jgi:hypothetical protein